jgi:hypothetical protein
LDSTLHGRDGCFSPKGTKKAGGSFHRPATLSAPALRRAVMTFTVVVLAPVADVLAVVFLHLEGVELVVWRAIDVGVALHRLEYCDFAR